MRRSLVATLVMLIILILPSILYAVDLTIPRHVDPAMLKEEFSIDALINQINLLNTYLATRDYGSVERVVKTLNESYVPQSIRDAISRLEEALDKFWRLANETHYLINSTEEMLNKGSIEKASDYLNKTYLNILTLKIFRDQFLDVLNRLRSIPGLNKYVSTLHETINKTIDNYEYEYLVLKTRLERSLETGLIQTILTINVSKQSISAGDQLSIYGELYYLNNSVRHPLSNKTIIIHVGDTIYTSRTDGKGFYNITRRINVYKESITIFSEYTPSGEDAAVYRYSRSNNVTVSIYFVKPLLKVYVDKERIIPGQVLRLGIETNTSLIIDIYSEILNVTGVGVDRFREVDVRIPDNISEGTYSLIISSRPRGYIAPVSTYVNITIYREDIEIIVNYPRSILAGLNYVIEVSTKPSSEIIVSASGISTSRVGEGVYLINTPYYYTESRLVLYVVAVPRDPGHRITYRVIEISVYNIFMLSLLIAVLSILTYSGLKILREQYIETRPRVGVLERSVDRSSISISGLEALGTLVEIIEKLFGEVLEKTMTLREYIDRLKDRMPEDLWARMRELFRGLEAYIYGGSRHRNLLSELRDLLRELVDKLSRLLREGLQR